MNFLSSPIKIKWFITNRCNLRCKFCYLEDYFGKDITKDEVDQILEILTKREVMHVSLLGGEPTESGHFIYILKELEKREIYFSFSSNGQNLFRRIDILEFLENSKYLTEAQISLESTNSFINDSVRGSGSYKNAINSIKALVERRVAVCLAMVVTKENHPTIQDMIKLSIVNNIRELRLMPFVPLGTGKKAKERLFLEFDSLVKYCSKVDIPVDSSLKVTTYLNDTELKNDVIGCGAGIVSCVINSDLSLSACPMLSQSQKSSNKVSSLETFDNIWRDSRVFNNWRGGKYKELMCQNKCPLFDECGGYQ
ncbi:TPA: radical SAM/SPASM domain-containing protein [Streptococcus suis]|uniref:radical SAM protein n=1 Tax=Streptococcus suis TaxID=1307 RepID=UPI0006B48A44|nr:radical SAM protein [Streptococcus suis]NQL92404.1 radical SAM protein [Streptococcus suis]HEL2139831.1 radical SAM protein [Streptococcus suis]HEL2140795.1 radical SAM protein [Streptococcus suis]HEM4094049.1 radical SAM protein [Streptococcus suis]HEM4145249.1 radical SAM protein [Streptococcus suis]